MAGLRWLARVGPAPLDAWRYAMGWSEVAARNHARRLEREGWLAGYPMRRGDGCLFVATRVGVAVASVPVRAPGEPAPTWWAHHCGVAWMAAWLTLRPREFKGSSELNAWDTWAGKISWRDYKRCYESRHRPDLVGFRLDGRPVGVEVELAPKSTARLRAILQMHASWRASGRTNGVLYVCGDEQGRERITKAAASAATWAAVPGSWSSSSTPSRSRRSRCGRRTRPLSAPAAPPPEAGQPSRSISCRGVRTSTPARSGSTASRSPSPLTSTSAAATTASATR